jgi:hypothetical protein
MAFDLSEILNPKKTLARREADSEGPPSGFPADAASAPFNNVPAKTMSQSEFGAGGSSKRQDPKKNAKFIELMRKQQQ